MAFRGQSALAGRQPTEERSMNELNLSLTLDELNIVMSGLGKLPLETSMNVWGKLRTQAEKQLNPQPVEELKNE